MSGIQTFTGSAAETDSERDATSTAARDSFGCVRNTIRVRSGVYFDLANPRAEDVAFEDIAGALANICRFGGQVPRFYSVAEHLFLCARQAESDLLPIEVQQAIILHDAAEAYVGDMVKPLKNMLPQYRAIEKRVEAAIASRFGVRFDHPEIWRIDKELLIAEKRALFRGDQTPWVGEYDVRELDLRLFFWSPERAEEELTQMAMRLGIAVV